MILKNRAYTNENGVVDDGMLTDHPADEVAVIGEWIRRNIRKSRSVLKGHTSYGLKHILEEDTHIYMTNNEFKDAMLLAGFQPVDANALNWTFRIVLLREENVNPSPFFKWVLKFGGESSLEGDFAADVEHDFEFPVFADYGIIHDYLENAGACDGAMEVFDRLWEAYEREHSREETCKCC